MSKLHVAFVSPIHVFLQSCPPLFTMLNKLSIYQTRWISHLLNMTYFKALNDRISSDNIVNFYQVQM